MFPTIYVGNRAIVVPLKPVNSISDDPECTWTIFKEGLLSSVEIPEERLYGVEDSDAPIDEIVESYAATLTEVVGGGDSPAPDMVGHGQTDRKLHE